MGSIPIILLTILLLQWPAIGQAKPLCKVGDKAQVLWGGKWWPAQVTAVGKNGQKCKIHYQGYGKNWDEWVGPKRIRVTSSASSGGSLTTSSFQKGQRVKALWGGKWWNAQILKTQDKRYYIKYDGYSNSWNEWVGSKRLKPR